jgi:Domain of unknown function (DUF6916)
MSDAQLRDLAKIKHSDFSEYKDEIFNLVVEDGAPVSLRLTKVDQPKSADSPRPFALLFYGPPEPGLSQRIYRLENAGFGAIKIFLVPVGKTDDGYIYEALFN